MKANRTVNIRRGERKIKSSVMRAPHHTYFRYTYGSGEYLKGRHLRVTVPGARAAGLSPLTNRVCTRLMHFPRGRPWSNVHPPPPSCPLPVCLLRDNCPSVRRMYSHECARPGYVHFSLRIDCCSVFMRAPWIGSCLVGCVLFLWQDSANSLLRMKKYSKREAICFERGSSYPHHEVFNFWQILLLCFRHVRLWPRREVLYP